MPALLVLVSLLVLCAPAPALKLEAEGDLGIEYVNKVNPGRTDRGSDIAYAFAGEVELGGRFPGRLKTKVKAGAEAEFFSEYSDNNTQTYFTELRCTAGRTTVQLEYDFMPEVLYFPSSSGDATYARNAVEVKLSRKIQKSWEASLGYEARWLDFVETHDGRDNRTNIIEFELEYGKNRLLRPAVVLEWRNRDSDDDNYDYRSRDIEFSLESSVSPLLGLRLDYRVGERTYLAPQVLDSNYHRIDARSGFAAEARIPVRNLFGVVLGYERQEKDSSREEEERSYRVNSFSGGVKIIL
jgi:hypothetical protein